MERLVNKIYVDFNGLNGFSIPAPEEFYVANGKHASVENLQYVQEALKKLYEYEKLEEQGLLLKLPCKVGDTIYITGMLGSPEIEEWEITEITMRWGENDEPYFYANLKRAPKGNNCSFWMKEFGRSVFLTKEEAEKHIREMEEK